MYKHQGVNRGARSPRWVLVMTGNEIGTLGATLLLCGALDLMCPWAQVVMPGHAPSNEPLHPRTPYVAMGGLPGELAHG